MNTSPTRRAVCLLRVWRLLSGLSLIGFLIWISLHFGPKPHQAPGSALVFLLEVATNPLYLGVLGVWIWIRLIARKETKKP